MKPSITISAPAKLNLCLAVVGRRADGYHLLESLVAFADYADVITVSPADGLSLALSGEFAEASGDVDDNLVLRAARLLQQQTNPGMGAHIALTKNIPVGAGLGGGSADAAATLHALNALWELNMPLDGLVSLGATLGADVAMCLHSKTLIARGIGEEIAVCEQPLPPIHGVLVYPHAKLLSKDVYHALAAMDGELKPVVALADTARKNSFPKWIEWLATDTRNDLQRPAIALSPMVAEVLQAMQVALPTPALVRMTGSGSCCFALFERHDEASAYASALLEAHPQWWVQATRLIQ